MPAKAKKELHIIQNKNEKLTSIKIEGKTTIGEVCKYTLVLTRPKQVGLYISSTPTYAIDFYLKLLRK